MNGTLRRIGLLNPQTWKATLYLWSYVLIGTVLFSLSITVIAVSFTLSITVIGFPLLVVAAVLVRGFAAMERWRARLVTTPIVGEYRAVETSGLMAQIKTRWADPATWRSCGYLILMYVPLFVLDTVIVTIWTVLLGAIALPFWYWSIPQPWDGGAMDYGVMIGYTPGPHHTFGDGGFGLWVGDLPTALTVAVVSVVLAALFSYVVVGTAKLHASVVRSLLGPSVDPLGDARRVLAEPGDLTRGAASG